MTNNDDTRDRLIEHINLTYEAFKAYEVPRIQYYISELVSKVNFYGAVCEFMNRRGNDLSDGLITNLAKADGNLVNDLWDYFNENEYDNVRDDSDIIYLLDEYSTEFKKQQATEM